MNTRVSRDGSDVDPSEQWVPQGSVNVLKRYLADALEAAVSATIQPEIDEVAQIVKNYAEQILGRMIDTRNVA